MIQTPLLLPARFSGSYAMRRSAALLWRAVDGLTFLSGQTPGYSRTGDAYNVDARGRLLRVVHSAPNIIMVDPKGNLGARKAPAILVNHNAATNGVHFSEDITQSGTWTQSNSPSFGANTLSHGDLLLRELRDTSGATQARIAQTLPSVRLGSGAARPYQLSFYVAYPSSSGPAAAGASVIVHDTTSGQERLKILLPYTGGFAPNFSAVTGTLLSVEYVGEHSAGFSTFSRSIYRVTARTTSSFDPDNAHEIRVHAADTASQQGSIFIGGFYMDPLQVLTGYVPTPAAATVTRTADSWKVPWLALPRAMTLFLDYISLGDEIQTGTYRCILIPSGGTPYVALLLDGSGYKVLFHNGSNVQESLLTLSATPGQRVRVRIVLTADGKAYGGARVQEGAEVVSAPTGGTLMPASWGTSPELQIRGPFALLACAVLFGERSMQFCETLVG